MDKKQTFSLWYVLAALVGMILLQEFFTPRHTQTLTYSEFKQALVAGKLDDVGETGYSGSPFDLGDGGAAYPRKQG